MLTTPQAVMDRAGIAAHPEYEDVSPITDAAGFYTFRRYPAGTELSQILTKDGRPAVRCYLAFIVDAPARGDHISRVQLAAWFARRWTRGRVFASSRNPDPYQPNPEDPNAPSEPSALLLMRTRKPIDLDSTDGKGYIYDSRDDAFLDTDGRVVSPIEILEEMYTKHCRTLRLGFRVRWDIGTAARWTIRQVVWKSQDGAMWALLNLYDVELVEEKKDKWRNPFHKYRPSDFRRTTEKEGERSHFFGFQTSKKSFFTNLAVVVGACVVLYSCVVLYYGVPHQGLLRVIYGNVALTTAALVFAFLLADMIGPWLLTLLICGLSRLRDAVWSFTRKVNV